MRTGCKYNGTTYRSHNGTPLHPHGSARGPLAPPTGGAEAKSCSPSFRIASQNPGYSREHHIHPYLWRGRSSISCRERDSCNASSFRLRSPVSLFSMSVSSTPSGGMRSLDSACVFSHLEQENKQSEEVIRLNPSAVSSSSTSHRQARRR